MNLSKIQLDNFLQGGYSFSFMQTNLFQLQPVLRIIVTMSEHLLTPVKHQIFKGILEGKTYEQLAVELEISQSRVCQLYRVAISQLCLQADFIPEKHLQLEALKTENEALKALNAKGQVYVADPTLFKELTMKRPIEQLDMTVKLYNLLKKCLINTVEDMLAHDYAWYARCYGMGKKSLIELREVMEALGVWEAYDHANTWQKN